MAKIKGRNECSTKGIKIHKKPTVKGRKLGFKSLISNGKKK